MKIEDFPERVTFLTRPKGATAQFITDEKGTVVCLTKECFDDILRQANLLDGPRIPVE